MAGNRKSRKRRRSRPAPAAPAPRPTATEPGPQTPAPEPRGYARSRARDEAARAALKPLRPGERPVAVTVGAIAAALLALANLLALLLSDDAGDEGITPGSDVTATIVAIAVLVLVAVGMWRARYWAVLGMQALLALTIIGAALATLGATNVWGFLLVLIILLSSGTLFWFLVKAMARIQMPERPGSQRTG
jgi:hypothetical protein